MVNIYTHLLGECPYITDMIIDGCGLSDYEKFYRICRVCTDFSLSGIYEDICKKISLAIGEAVPVSRGTAEYIWRKYNGEECVAPTVGDIKLNIKYMIDGEFENVITLPDGFGFVRPDKYHAELAMQKKHNGEEISRNESDMLCVQNIRQRAIECKLAGKTLVIDACAVRGEMLCRIIEYLRREKFMPTMLIICDAGDILPKDGKIIRAVRFPCDVQYVADSCPIGRVIFIMREDLVRDFSDEISKLSDKRRKAEKIYDNLVTVLEKYRVNY